MNIYQRYLARGDKTYYGRYTGPDPDQPGQRKRYLRNLGTEDKATALTALRTLKKAADAGRFDALETSKLRQNIATLAQIYSIYRKRSKATTRASENNILSLRAIIRRGLKTPETTPATELDTLSARTLTANLMADFQHATLAAAGSDNLKRDSATITANSYRRQARSLFSPELLPFYAELALPDLKPFLAVRPLKEPEKRYRMPEANLIATLRAKAADLKASDPNSYRIWLLALGAGLRKREIAFARWSWIETTSSPLPGDAPGVRAELTYAIHLQTTDDFRTKSGRERIVPLEPTAYAELLALRIPTITTPSGPDYILDGHLTERYDLSFDRFSSWMVSHGWTRKKKAHELRKIFGSYVNAQAGLSAAQDLLGHSDISTTKGYYVSELSIPKIKIFG